MLKRNRSNDSVDEIPKKYTIFSMPLLDLIDDTIREKGKLIVYIKNYLINEYRIKRYILAGYPILLHYKDVNKYPLNIDTFEDFIRNIREELFNTICKELPMNRFKLVFDYKGENSTIGLDIIT